MSIIIGKTNAQVVNNSTQGENIFMQFAYPIVNKANSGISFPSRGWTGAFQPIEAGTYKAVLEDYDVVGNGYKWAVNGSDISSYNIENNQIYDSGWVIIANEFTFTINTNLYIGFYFSKQDNTSFSAPTLNSLVKIKLFKIS